MFSHFGAALILSVVFSSTFGFKLTPLFLLINIIFSYLPDIDIPVELIQRKKLGGKEHGFHREILHYPLLYFIISLLLVIVLNYRWALIFILTTYAHFLLDSVQGGWGIKWLWPFSSDRIKLFADPKTGNTCLNLIARWNKKEFLEVSHKYGDDNWFKNLFLKPSMILATDLLIFAIGVVTFLLYVST